MVYNNKQFTNKKQQLSSARPRRWVAWLQMTGASQHSWFSCLFYYMQKTVFSQMLCRNFTLIAADNHAQLVNSKARIIQHET